MGHLVEAVSLEETLEVLPLLSPHCPVAISACPFAVQLTAAGLQYWPPRGSIWAAQKHGSGDILMKKVQTAPQTPKFTDDSWGVCLLPRHFLAKG